METKECTRCHRVGERGYFPSGDYGWVCLNEGACNRRVITRTAKLIAEQGGQIPAKVKRRTARIMAAATMGRSAR